MEFGLITRFLCFCAGASLKVLKECPIEVNKYIGIGATVLFTGVLAAISGSYALYSVFYGTTGAIFLAVFFGIFWGLLIFNLDRYIVSSLKKNGNKWKEFATAFPRLLVAVVISMVIAKPLEVRIFKDRVERQIHENKLRKLVDDKKKINEIYEQDKLNDALITKNSELARIEKEMNSLPEGAAFQKLYTAMQEAERDFEETSTAGNSRIKQLQRRISQIYETQPNRLFDAKGRLIAESITPGAYRKIQACNREAYLLRKKIDEKEEKFLQLQKQVDRLLAQHRTQVQDRLAQAKKELTAINREKAVADSLAYSQFARGNQVNQKTYQATLITQLEAMGTLTEERFTTMWWASFFISLLFILVETSPIIVKLIAQKGPYEMIMERHEYEIMLSNKKKISLIKSQIGQKHFLEQLEMEAEEKEQMQQHKKEKTKQYATAFEAPSPPNFEYEEPSAPALNSAKEAMVKSKELPRAYMQETLLEGITWKRTDANDALCYVFRNRKKDKPGEFLLISNGDVSYGKWDYSDKQKIWIELWGERFIYEIRGLNNLYLQLKKQYDHTTMTFRRM